MSFYTNFRIGGLEKDDDPPCRNPSSRRSLVAKILIFRLLLLLSMGVSCYLIPDHNPGDDVHRFDLRLSEQNLCFCLPEQSCGDLTARTALSCSMTTTTPNSSQPRILTTAVWKFFLSPLTKWDAARFLNLAVRPSLRDPPISCQEGDDDDDDTDIGTCDFSDSEQAHAFFPFYPLILHNVAIVWIRWAPASMFLPPTFECLVVLVGVLVNTACLILATLSLYSLTMSILLPIPSLKDNKLDQRRQIATAACLVYGIWNPASVFFATNYSESLFGALTLLGHASFVKQKYWLAIPTWMMASFTRSNGSIHCLWLLLQAIGHVCLFTTNPTSRKGNTSTISCLSTILTMVGGAILIFLPVRHHDITGYARHCDNPDIPINPLWCDNQSSSFSLYGWTQRRHWNVGFFRYYDIKQIPNFLLAAPIMGLSAMGVVLWIRNSMMTYGKGKLPSTPYMLLLGWPIRALADSVSDQPDASQSSSDEKSIPLHDFLVYNPRLLGHYAILAGLTLVGLVVAHIQISTRMICSSSPAIIWFLTWCRLQDKSVRLRQFVEVYTALFMILGVILHVNFLPWT